MVVSVLPAPDSPDMINVVDVDSRSIVRLVKGDSHSRGKVRMGWVVCRQVEWSGSGKCCAFAELGVKRCEAER